MRLASALVALALLGPAAADAVPPPFGGLTALPGTAGCISGNPMITQCSTGHAFGSDGYSLMTLSPDGRSAYLTSDEVNSVVVLARDPVSGALAQSPGSAGCISEDGSGGTCVDGVALASPEDVAVSPDGKNVYVASEASNAVAAMARDGAGGLSPLPGQSACTSDDGSGGTCVNGVALVGARGVAVSPDGKNVYVTADTSDAVAVFSRDQTTGALTQLPGLQGCVSRDTTGGQCDGGNGIDGARGVTVSPDGANVYVTGQDSQSVAAFTRDRDSGALTQLGGDAGCVSQSDGTCAPGRAVTQTRHLAVSPDGHSVYVASLGGGLAVFSRDAAAGGALTQLSGPAGCITENGSGGDCTDGVAVDQANTVAISPDGRTAYVASIDDVDALLTFDRDPATGALTQLPGGAGCVSRTGTGGACATGPPLAAATSVVVSPDGRNVYLHAEGAAAVDAFARELPPVCTDVSHAVPFGAPTVIPLTCSDPNGDPITRTIVTAPLNGKLAAVNPNGSVLYTPPPRFRGIDSFTFRASDGSLGSNVAVASPLVTPDTIRPKISRASVSPRVFAVRVRTAAALKRATTFRYRLSENARMVIVLQRARPRRHGRPQRFKRVGRLSQRATLGNNKLRFNGRIRRRTLKPGSYRAILVATDPAGNRSKQRRLGFRIVSARRH